MQLREIEHALRAMLDESRAREEQTGWRAVRRRLRELKQSTSRIFSRSRRWDEETRRWSWRRRLKPAQVEETLEDIPEQNEAEVERSGWRLFRRNAKPGYFEQRRQELANASRAEREKEVLQQLHPDPQPRSVERELLDIIEESTPERVTLKARPSTQSTRTEPARNEIRKAEKEKAGWRPFQRAKPAAVATAKARPAPARAPMRPTVPVKAVRNPDRRSDLVIAGLGVGLGLFCALFPWYVFLNQEKFGVQALQFSGSGQGTRPARIAFSSRYETVEAPFADEDLPFGKLDPFVTASLPSDDVPRVASALADQPFPGDEATFSLVHVVNGRAMIEDETGLWVVQRGSLLPDNSRVASIELRGKKWVLVTSADKIVELSQ